MLGLPKSRSVSGVFTGSPHGYPKDFLGCPRIGTSIDTVEVSGSNPLGPTMQTTYTARVARTDRFFFCLPSAESVHAGVHRVRVGSATTCYCDHCDGVMRSRRRVLR